MKTCNRKFFNTKNGFTLAEVLITLVIVGVIASMTIPTLVHRYKKQEVASKLKKFYSGMQQALNSYLYSESMNAEQLIFPDDTINNYSKSLEFWNNSIGKYLVTIKKEYVNDAHPRIYLADGSTFTFRIAYNETMHIFYCINGSCRGSEDFDGKNSFLFSIKEGKLYTGLGTDMSRQNCLNNCKREDSRYYCSRLIQMDGWQIKDDYPWY